MADWQQLNIYLNAMQIFVLRNSKMVYASRLNCTAWSCPRNFTKLRPVVFEFLVHKFIHKMKTYSKWYGHIITLEKIRYYLLNFYMSLRPAQSHSFTICQHYEWLTFQNTTSKQHNFSTLHMSKTDKPANYNNNNNNDRLTAFDPGQPG